MHKYNSDTIGVCPVERDIYNVRTLPHECFPRPHVKRYIPPPQEQLEREFYGRLQGYNGFAGPFIGKIARCFLWIIFFPIYGLLHLSLKVKRLTERLVTLLKPYMYMLLDWDRRLSKRIMVVFDFIALKWAKIRSAWEKFRYWVYANTFLPLEQKSGRFLKRVAKKLQFLRPIITGFKRLMHLSLNVPSVQLPSWRVPKIAVRQSKIILRMNARTLKISQFLERQVNRLRLRIYRTRIWLQVLAGYADRVLSDWILEIKQWFQPSK